MQIGVIGTGTIASAVVRGLVGDGHQFLVSARSAPIAEALAADFDSVRIADNQSILDGSDVILVGLLAHTARDVLSAVRFDVRHRVISFMADASPADVSGWIAPATFEALVLPFPAIAQGGSPVLSLGTKPLVESIFGRRNSVFHLENQAELDAYLCAQAVLSPVASLIDASAGWLATRVADGPRGEAFLRALVCSSLSNLRADVLIDALNTPGGYNQRLRQHLEAAGAPEALRAGLDALARGS